MRGAAVHLVSIRQLPRPCGGPQACSELSIVQSAQLSKFKALTTCIVEDQSYVETACNKYVAEAARVQPRFRLSLLSLFAKRRVCAGVAASVHCGSSVRLTADGYVCEVRLPSQFLCDFTQDCASKLELLRVRIHEIEATLLPLVDGSACLTASSSAAHSVTGKKGGGWGDSRDAVLLDPRKPVTPELIRLVLIAQNAALVRLAGGPVVTAHESVRDLCGCMCYCRVYASVGRLVGDDGVVRQGGGAGACFVSCRGGATTCRQVDVLRREYRALRRAVSADGGDGGRYGTRKSMDADPFDTAHGKDVAAEQKQAQWSSRCVRNASAAWPVKRAGCSAAGLPTLVLLVWCVVCPPVQRCVGARVSNVPGSSAAVHLRSSNAVRTAPTARCNVLLHDPCPGCNDGVIPAWLQHLQHWHDHGCAYCVHRPVNARV